ncbi:hypothetical protein QEJ31_07745 [Pigmentibacter sp. JX0631]|uniref:hypothetical protein n=1 Tax=Pigmentibacter sp. JX0631 TaxID=2976982 RepID=UPI00246972F8|nr:hypothetical protein [Pigmentibacter sp. JX0631]WGL61481.1 hypothetical protein QEJ31_07745 [Pigmentibacter sp. JX0631]
MDKFIEVILENKIYLILTIVTLVIITVSVSFNSFKKTKNKSIKIVQKNNIVNGNMAGRDIRK